ncbi:Putative transcriptional repressor [Sodalis praecaptivus]|uniref:Putative transcriptional repressor n=1 Tax=Sodalis praecaptivus TaxID=1239307 RepID=W0HWB4_9GAMM|nr:TetR/AcrR family transcriptional regulator [Sodalis praecaptivus]AHF78064.1 Putative transcriptional repressor [Sodalis praecaptivus]
MSSKTAVTALRGRGRPKHFDADAALDVALRLFWQHGFEATSMHDLVAATGAKAPTLYHAFGNKEGLFRAAMERYLQRFVRKMKPCLDNPHRSVAGATEDFLTACVAQFTGEGLPPGCFLICTSSALSADSQPIAALLRSHNMLPEQLLRDFYRERQIAGELPPSTDTVRLAKYLACQLQGMAVQARDGVSRRQLCTLVALIMALWPQLARLPAASPAVAHGVDEMSLGADSSEGVDRRAYRR